ncbi:Arginine--pyruvate transaminase AruH [Pseudoruegeria aquimaris]|uniref:Aminotransferase n=1 Tax=Pseudoruegeria aquimaris TaxID=393663 RepID=A0A1Y5R7K8_9RHOB|nr:pyridoxal phosphate-dependent aminotransferase [Pseudoruegeria aquimaris]SLN10973.1 Arginine--pyruvate transaminase AruH [Pseudoruegeria aquimaris]
MQISKRLTGLTGGGSDGWGLFAKARAMVARGEAVTELTIGEHDIGTDPEILAAMDASARGGHTGYAAVPGTPALRAEIARRVAARTGVPTGPENVLVTPGGQAALFAAHMATCAPGDRALFIDPYYATYPGTLRGAGAEPVAVPARSRDQFQPRPAEIDARAEGARSLLINTPNNPTGVVYSPETLAGIAEVCRARDLWLVSDEVYDTQVWEGRHLSPRSLPGMAERTLVIGSMSKSHAMTGSRIGWIVGPPDAISHLANLATHTTYGVPGFIQDAALHALRQGTRLEEAIAAPFRRRREIALGLLAGQDIVRLIPAGGAMYLMLDIRATGLSGEAFAEALLERHRIAVMPGESFGTCAAGHLRVAMTVEDAAFAEALSTLMEFARECATCDAI